MSSGSGDAANPAYAANSALATRTAYVARWILPISAAPVEHGVVIVRGAQVEYAGANDRADRLHGARVVDLGNSALMPGLVNVHTHLELTGMRGMLEGVAFRDWLRTLTAARRDVFTAESLLDAARSGIDEALRYGITTFADTSDSGTPLEAMRERGVRGVCYIETFGPDPRQRDGAITQLRERVGRYRDTDTALVRTGISPHAPYTVSVPLFEAVAEYAHADGLPVAVHIAESAAESAFVREGIGPFADGLRSRGIDVRPIGRSPVAALEATGLLAVRPLLIHAVRIDRDDLALISARRATIAHCPISNAKLGHGIAPLQAMLDAGVAVGLGTDSVVSNDRVDLLSEARQAALLAAVVAGAPDSLSASSALRLATLGGAQALGLDERIGTLDIGKDADLVAFPLDGPDVGPVFDPAVSLVHVMAGSVRASLVTVAGRELVVNGVAQHQYDGLETRTAATGERLQAWMRMQR